MRASQYRLIAEHPLRNVFRSMVQDRRDLPSVSELRAAIDAAVPEGTDAVTKQKLFDSALALAQRADGNREDWFDLRGDADRRVLAVVESWQAADLLLPSQVEEDEDTEVVDVKDVLDNIEATERGPYYMEQKAQAEAQAAARRELGLS